MILLKTKILVLMLLLTGCAGLPLSNPTERDLEGTWVSVGIVPYAVLEYRAGEVSVLAMGGAEGEVEMATVENFIPLENEFSIVVRSSGDEEDPTEFMGSFWGGQLALQEKGVEEFTLWFSRSEVTEKSRHRVRQAVKDFFSSEN